MSHGPKDNIRLPGECFFTQFLQESAVQYDNPYVY